MTKVSTLGQKIGSVSVARLLDSDLISKLSWQILLFSPLLAVYFLVLVLLPDRIDDVDAGRYWNYAQNLAQGFYADPDDPKLNSGPGYPLYLLPFQLLNTPRWFALVGQVFMSLGAVLFLFNTLREYISIRGSVLVAFIAGLYPVYLWYLPVITTEPLSWFLSAALIWSLIRACRTTGPAWRYVIYAGISLGLLTLTKVFFGYVSVFIGLCFLILFSLYRDIRLLKGAQIAGLALIICLPYLTYTYSLTGRIFYWGTNGGEQLYFLASSHEGEFGDWANTKTFLDTERGQRNAERREFFESLEGLSKVESNDAFRNKAIELIKEDPKPYLKNWVAGIGRTLFKFPYSFREQSLTPAFYVSFNMLWLVPLLFSILPALLYRKLIPLEVWMAFGTVAVYLGGVSLVSSVTRNLIPAMPFLTLWLGYFYFRFLNIRINTSSGSTT